VNSAHPTAKGAAVLWLREGARGGGGERRQQEVRGLPAEGVNVWAAGAGAPRWCSGCAKGHAGAVDVVSKKCEGCGLKQPHFGLPAEGRKRWCSGCAKGHEGAVDISHKKCEGCGLKSPSFGLPAEGKKRWCFGCAKGLAGAVDGPQWRTQAGGSPQKKRKATVLL
jgi:hypothetical protein